MNHNRDSMTLRAICACLALSLWASGMARAEEAAPASAAASASSEAPSGAETPSISSDDRAKAEIADVLGFEQSKATAQMTELEERMFRLSEGLRQLEPENASRLLLALKLAREELIRLQMSQTEGLFKDIKLGEAVTEVKQIMAKLERLRELLLSTDLDFQLRLEQLRLTRQLMRELDAAIREESREQKESAEAHKNEDDAARLRKKTADLKELIERQKSHLDEATRLADANAIVNDRPASVGKLAEEQRKTSDLTKILAAKEKAQQRDAAGLNDASEQMLTATGALEGDKVAEAPEPQRRALELLEKSLAEDKKQLKEAKQQTTSDKYAGMQRDQSGNRRSAERIAQSLARLGDGAAAARQEMLRADGAMSGAEQSLGSSQAGSASGQQQEALKSLQQAQNELKRLEQDLLDALGPEIRKRVIEALTEMREKQTAIRESTESLIPRVATGARAAIQATVQLAESEAALVTKAEELTSLVEETQFGIALPAALMLVRRQMDDVRATLSTGTANEAVVAAELRIEEDLSSLLEAMERMPSTRPSKPGQPGDPNQERERELNRLLAEVRMLRMLQLRVNGDTVETDGERTTAEIAENEKIRAAISALEKEQERIRAVTDQLSRERLSQ